MAPAEFGDQDSNIVKLHSTPIIDGRTISPENGPARDGDDEDPRHKPMNLPEEGSVEPWRRQANPPSTER